MFSFLKKIFGAETVPAPVVAETKVEAVNATPVEVPTITEVVAKPAKAAAKPKVEAENIEDSVETKPAKVSKKSNTINLIIFESGASYSSGNLFFSREDSMKEVSDEEYAFLLSLENFRRADPHEIEEYLASKED